MLINHTSRKTDRGQRSQVPPPYKIIYNWDGAPLDYSEYPQSQEQFLDKVYAPIEDTQVGALFWCVGVHEAEWPSDTMEMVGDSVNRVYNSVRAMRHAENIRAMFERGENPYAAMIERGRKIGVDVYASIRMNDNHFYAILPEDMAQTTKLGLTQLRKDHPEWCLSADQVPEQRGIGSWNFAIPEVREHRLQHISEVCRVTDWAGLELDWQRHAFHLPTDDAYRLRYTLTDLQRAVRQMTDEIAQQRGRPYYLAVRVAATMEACRRIGYDLEAWVSEGLCDIIIPAGNSGTDPGAEIEKFKSLTEGTAIQIYGGLDSLGRQSAYRLISRTNWEDAWVRATANGYWEQGTDGIYVFNWHANNRTKRNQLTTIGSPQTLKRTNKVYTAIHRGPPVTEIPNPGAVNDRIYGETAVCLFQGLTVGGPTFHVSVHDEVLEEAETGNLAKVELQIELEHFSTADEVEVMLDGKRLPPPSIRDAAAEDLTNPSDASENSWLVWQLQPDQADLGRHEIEVSLMKRDASISTPLVVGHVEIYVTYHP